MQLPVVVAIISYSGPVYWLNAGGRRPASGWVQSVVVGIDRLREAGGQHYRAAPVQQQRLLAARPSGQDAVYAEHPGGHHPGEETGNELPGKLNSLVETVWTKRFRAPWKSSPKTASLWLWRALFCRACAPLGLVSVLLNAVFNGSIWAHGWFYSPLTSPLSCCAGISCYAARGVNSNRSVYCELIQLRLSALFADFWKRCCRVTEALPTE